MILTRFRQVTGEGGESRFIHFFSTQKEPLKSPLRKNRVQFYKSRI